LCIVNHDSRLVFCHVPRTGGTSIETVPWVGGNSHWGVGRLRDLCTPEQWAAYFTFAFVRNPFDRLVSAFTGYRTFPPVNVREVYETAQALMEKHGDDREAFRAWCRCVVPRWLACDPHMKMQSRFVVDSRPGAVPLDFVGRFETLQADFDHVCRAMGREPQPLAHHRRGQRGPWPEYYDAPMQAMVASWYAEDLNRFAYAPGRE